MANFRHVTAVCVLFALGGPAVSADDVAVGEFRALEEAWSNSIKAQDRARLERFLAPDFGLTVAVAGALVHVDRESWLENAVTSYAIHEFQFLELDVREYGNTVVVSSRYTQTATVDGGDRSAEFFLTDVWVKSGEVWQVSARYSSRPEAAEPPNDASSK